MMVVEFTLRGNRAGNRREPARHQKAGGAMRAHRSDQVPCPAGQFGFCQRAVDQACRMATKQGDTFIQRCLEIKFAPHGALGDRDDGVGKPGDACHVVKGLGCDDGAVHVGEQQFLPARRGWQDVDVDAGFGDLLPQIVKSGRFAASDRNVPRPVVLQPSGGRRLGLDPYAGKARQPVLDGEAGMFRT